MISSFWKLKPTSDTLYSYMPFNGQLNQVMERKKMILCCVAGFLGLLSACAGFAAEAKRGRVQFPSPTECVYPGSPAPGLGLTAALALLLAHIILNVSTGCLCCRKGVHQSNSNWTWAITCYLVSWFAFVVAFLLLLTASALSERGGESMYFGRSYGCYVVKPGVFAGASILSLASVALAMICYLLLTRENRANVSDPVHPVVPPSHGGIAMGQPQFLPLYPPPQNAYAQSPLFVHEDTYMRRQFT